MVTATGVINQEKGRSIHVRCLGYTDFGVRMYGFGLNLLGGCKPVCVSGYGGGRTCTMEVMPRRGGRRRRQHLCLFNITSSLLSVCG